MSLRAPTSRYEAAWQQWNYGGGGMRGEPPPRPEDYPDDGGGSQKLMPRPEDYPDDGGGGSYGSQSAPWVIEATDYKPSGDPSNAPPLVPYEKQTGYKPPRDWWTASPGGDEPPPVPRDAVPIRDELIAPPGSRMIPRGGGVYGGGGYGLGIEAQSPTGRAMLGGMAGQAMRSPAGRGLMGGLMGAGWGRLSRRPARRPQSLAAISRGEQV